MLRAFHDQWFWLKAILLALLAMLALAALSTGKSQFVPPPAERSRAGEEWSAIESNTLLIRRDLSAGTALVAFGTEMDILEHRGLLEALKAPGNEDTVREELLALRGALKADLARHMPTEAQRLLRGLSKGKLLEALTRAAYTGAPAAFGFDEFQVEVGFATYSYWQVLLGANEKELREIGERTIVLPQSKQAYVKLTLRVPFRVRL